MIVYRKKGASPCCLDRAADAPFKLDQNYSLTQLDLHTHVILHIPIILEVGLDCSNKNIVFPSQFSKFIPLFYEQLASVEDRIFLLVKFST
jgi:hypothetical protein